MGPWERPVPTFAVALLLGAGLATLLFAGLVRRAGVKFSDAVSVALVALGSGVLGAAALDVAINFRSYLANPGSPGLVWYGGLFAGLLAAWLFAMRFRLPWREILDAGTPAVAVGQMFGRLGCLAGGCCYGSPAEAPWPGVLYGDPRAPATESSRGVMPLHPVQLYEAGGLLLLGLLTLALHRRGWARHRLIVVHLVGYALLRLGTEHLRGDPTRGQLLGLSTSTILALLILAAAPLLWIRLQGQRSATRGPRST